MNHEPYVFGFLMSLVVIAVFVVAFGKSKKAMYEQDVIYLENFVYDSDVNRENYDFILLKFDSLSRNNQDRTRTEKLWNIFIFKYRQFWYDSALRKGETGMIVRLQNEIIPVEGKKTVKSEEHYRL